MSTPVTGNPSVWSNPQILGALLPGFNIQALDQAMQAELNVDAQPLAQMSQQLSGLQQQLGAWQTLQSALTNLQTDASALSSATLYQGVAATSSDPAAVAVTAGGKGTPGSYQVAVQSLMQPEIDNSAAQASQTATLGYSGSFSVNGISVQVASSDSLQGIAQDINAANAGVTATVLPSGGQYVLNIASVEGQAITWSDPAGILTGLGVLSGSPLAPAHQVQAAAEASYTINGVAETSPTNTDATSIPGVTLTLLAPTATAASVVASQNQAAISGAFQQLAKDYNTVIADWNKYSGKGGELEGNATVLGISGTLQQTLSAVNASLPDGEQSLPQLGVTISAPVGSPDQLSMSVNTSTLQAALSADPNAVQQLMQATGSGIAQQLGAQLATLVGADGAVTGQISSLQSQITSLSGQINDQNSPINVEITQQQKALQTDFQNMLTALMESQSQGQQIQQFLAVRYGSGSTSSSGGGGGTG